jgi:hypothetical protein
VGKEGVVADGDVVAVVVNGADLVEGVECFFDLSWVGNVVWELFSPVGWQR